MQMLPPALAQACVCLLIVLLSTRRKEGDFYLVLKGTVPALGIVHPLQVFRTTWECRSLSAEQMGPREHQRCAQGHTIVGAQPAFCLGPCMDSSEVGRWGRAIRGAEPSVQQRVPGPGVGDRLAQEFRGKKFALSPKGTGEPPAGNRQGVT